jgi:hypothetical protein
VDLNIVLTGSRPHDTISQVIYLSTTNTSSSPATTSNLTTHPRNPTYTKHPSSSSPRDHPWSHRDVAITFHHKQSQSINTFTTASPSCPQDHLHEHNSYPVTIISASRQNTPRNHALFGRHCSAPKHAQYHHHHHLNHGARRHPRALRTSLQLVTDEESPLRHPSLSCLQNERLKSISATSHALPYPSPPHQQARGLFERYAVQAAHWRQGRTSHRCC